MRRMGFSTHPGPLPFVTVRRQQWANRLTLGENIEIHGEHGCDMPPTAAKVVLIEEYNGPMVPAYRNLYGGRELVNIGLAVTDEPWTKVGESWFRSVEISDNAIYCNRDGVQVLDAHKKPQG